MKIIITGHGHYASGMYSSIEMLSNPQNVIAVDFLSADTDETLEKKYTEILHDEEYIFVCDLMGGTPYKVATKISLQRSNIRVTTGVNIGGLIDTNLKLARLDLEEAALNLIEASKKNIFLVEIKKETEENTDGI